MSKAVIFVLLIAGTMFSQGCSAQEAEKDSTSVSVGKNDTTLAPFLVDVRTPQEFAEGSVPGAVNIPLDQIETRIAEFEGKGEIVVFCRSGNRSSQAKTILENHGIANVVNGGSWEDVKKTYTK